MDLTRAKPITAGLLSHELRMSYPLTQGSLFIQVLIMGRPEFRQNLRI